MMNLYDEINKEEIRKLELSSYQGDVVIIEDHGSAIKASRELSHEKLLGFDTERKPSFKKGQINPISLVQIASGELVYLFRIHLFKVPAEFIRLLEDPSVLKIGVGLDDDFTGLRNLFNFSPRGFVDLSKYFQANKYQQSSLKYLAAMVLNVRISKNQQVSNWERQPLSASQVKYAATDAWIPREIYLHMRKDGNDPLI